MSINHITFVPKQCQISKKKWNQNAKERIEEYKHNMDDNSNRTETCKTKNFKSENDYKI